ncbi:hypothetical protein [Rothia koreensis]|nr:hypothetical protein [Rothia koreensis]
MPQHHTGLGPEILTAGSAPAESGMRVLVGRHKVSDGGVVY